MLNNLSATGKFTIRDARPSDGEFIARNVLAAMGYEVFNVDADSAIEFGSTSLNVQDAVKLVGEICARPDTLYSYARTRIACVEGNAVGSLTAYSGDDYLSLRVLTWGLLNSMFEGAAPSEDEDPTRSAACFPSVEVSNGTRDHESAGEDILVMEPECLPGEFYLDSMAVLPEFRRMAFEYAGATDRIGHLLMLDGIEEGRRKGFPRISLIVDKSKPRLFTYYSALGFRPDGEILFLGHLYDRMIKELD